jgi:hypothetical protein
MPEWILLLPILFPIVGALIFKLVLLRLPKYSQLLAILFLVLELAAILVNIAPGSHTLVLSAWQAASFSVMLQLDGVTLLVLLAMFVPLIAIWLIAPPQSAFGFLPTLVISAAVTLALSASTIAIYIAWAIFDLAIFAWQFAYHNEPGNNLRTLAVSQLAAFGVLMGAVLIVSPSDAGLWLAIAFWARLAVFPFHWTLPMRGNDAHDLWLARGIPLLAASALWMRWAAFQTQVPSQTIGTLAAIALAAQILWMWREEIPMRAALIGAAYSVSFIPLAVAFDPEASIAYVLWLALSTAVALAFFEMAQRWRAENRNRYSRLLWFAGFFMLTGLPLTPAMLGRLGVYVALWENGQAVLLLWVSIASMWILAPLWNFGFDLKGTDSREPTRIEIAGLIVIGLAILALTIVPILIPYVFSPALGDATNRAIDRVIRTNDFLGVVMSVILLIVPIVASYGLRLLVPMFHVRPNSWLVRLGNFFELDWLERLAINLGTRISGMLSGAVTIAEENPTVWVLFVALWVAIFITIAK